MARKNVFSRALEAAQDADSETPDDERVTPDAERRTAPNVRYFEDSFEEQLRRTAQDIDPGRISMGPVADRIDLESGLDALVDTIRESGQQVPALIRKGEDGGYIAVYGRRRILACRKLGRPVRAIVTELTEDEALIAQGLENAARLDTSYIEKALFVSRIEAAGFGPNVIQRALGIDKAALSRFRSAAREIPVELIEAIGAAHGAGRRQWEALRKLISADGAPSPARLREMIDPALESSNRLSDLIAKLSSTAPAQAPAPAVEVRKISRGVTLRRRGRAVTVNVSQDADQAFLDYLESELPALHEHWETRHNEE
jgi:ParB family chromosome partitioning protein